MTFKWYSGTSNTAYNYPPGILHQIKMYMYSIFNTAVCGNAFYNAIEAGGIDSSATAYTQAPRNQTYWRECAGLVSPGAGILTVCASFIIFSTAFPPSYWISALFYPIVRADRGPSCSLLERPTHDLQFCILPPGVGTPFSRILGT